MHAHLPPGGPPYVLYASTIPLLHSWTAGSASSKMPPLGASFFWTSVIGCLLWLLVSSYSWQVSMSLGQRWAHYLAQKLTHQAMLSKCSLCPGTGSKWNAWELALVEKGSQSSSLAHHGHSLPCPCQSPAHVQTSPRSKLLEVPKSCSTVLLLTSLIRLFDIWCPATLICFLLLYPELIKRQDNWLVLADNEVCVYESGVCLLGSSVLPWFSLRVVSPVVLTPGELPGAWKKPQLCPTPALHRLFSEPGPKSCLVHPDNCHSDSDP